MCDPVRVNVYPFSWHVHRQLLPRPHRIVRRHTLTLSLAGGSTQTPLCTRGVLDDACALRLVAIFHRP